MGGGGREKETVVVCLVRKYVQQQQQRQRKGAINAEEGGEEPTESLNQAKGSGGGGGAGVFPLLILAYAFHVYPCARASPSSSSILLGCPPPLTALLSFCFKSSTDHDTTEVLTFIVIGRV